MPYEIHPSVALGAQRPEDDIWGYMAVSLLGPATAIDMHIAAAIRTAREYRRRPYPKNRQRLESAISMLEAKMHSYQALMTSGMGNQVGQAVNVTGMAEALCKALIAENPEQQMRRANAYGRLLGW